MDQVEGIIRKMDILLSSLLDKVSGMKKERSDMKHDLAGLKQHQTTMGRKVTIILDEQTAIQEDLTQIRKKYVNDRKSNFFTMKEIEFNSSPSINEEDEKKMSRIKKQLEEITSQK
ncbi:MULTISPECIES: hypothetical protein [Bacillaceae]|uniref:hypothetical protein n=1 Tax=Bacillaceae TaxID=186817 RepID=UPI000BFB9B7D|nr:MULTISPECIES: hypothetical protein [Bacillaceae]PGT89063.1 hypothetical protein COD11_05145 [Bacillus sp. AFS040349]UGB30719.1 hypothetical protein LPC09_23980 [Metabacillus sp. B2-18]